ncbi:zinc-ribbon domain-containing protein [Butyrivibrio sp. VCB2001]|uniref:zinc-ribbon domain-containing protein n=1 Tax=Butyrivibrio sp. VCB2001 TaxID=1280667 RepID=UPI00040A0977|nr:zinc-ribbon domain-containing protein [Butyrivibrio sp. VCB2001]
MYCSKCGAEVKETAEFCYKCGCSLKDERPEESSKRMISFQQAESQKSNGTLHLEIATPNLSNINITERSLFLIIILFSNALVTASFLFDTVEGSVLGLSVSNGSFGMFKMINKMGSYGISTGGLKFLAFLSIIFYIISALYLLNAFLMVRNKEFSKVAPSVKISTITGLIPILVQGLIILVCNFALKVSFFDESPFSYTFYGWLVIIAAISNLSYSIKRFIAALAKDGIISH